MKGLYKGFNLFSKGEWVVAVKRNFYLFTIPFILQKTFELKSSTPLITKHKHIFYLLSPKLVHSFVIVHIIRCFVIIIDNGGLMNVKVENLGVYKSQLDVVK